MATPSSTFVAIIDQLRTQLVARGGMANTVIVTGRGDQTNPSATTLLELAEGSCTVETISMNDATTIGTLEVEYRINFRITADATGTVETADGANTTAKAARDAAQAVLTELEGEMDDDTTINGTCGMANVEGWEWEDSLTTTGHRAVIEGTVYAKATVT